MWRFNAADLVPIIDFHTLVWSVGANVEDVYRLLRWTMLADHCL